MVELVWQLRSQTSLPLAWSAERLQMGDVAGSVALLPADRCLLRI
jgi:hypothetical protein